MVIHGIRKKTQHVADDKKFLLTGLRVKIGGKPIKHDVGNSKVNWSLSIYKTHILKKCHSKKNQMKLEDSLEKNDCINFALDIAVPILFISSAGRMGMHSK